MGDYLRLRSKTHSGSGQLLSVAKGRAGPDMNRALRDQTLECLKDGRLTSDCDRRGSPWPDVERISPGS